MERKYLNRLKDFEDFLESLEPEKETYLYVEDPEMDDEPYKYSYRKTELNGSEVIVYETVCGTTNILSDYMGVIRYDDWVESMWEDLIEEGGTVYFESL